MTTDDHIQAAMSALDDYDRGGFEPYLLKAIACAQLANVEAIREQTAVLQAAFLPDPSPLRRLPGAGPATAREPRAAAPVPPPWPGASR